MIGMKIIFSILCFLAHCRAQEDKKTTGREFFKFVVAWASVIIWLI